MTPLQKSISLTENSLPLSFMVYPGFSADSPVKGF